MSHTSIPAGVKVSRYAVPGPENL